MSVLRVRRGVAAAWLYLGLGLITFIASWNNVIGPLIGMRSPESDTLPLTLLHWQSPVHAVWVL